MPAKIIKAPDFKGTTELSLEQWRSLEVTGAASAPGRLATNWGGSVLGFTICKLSNDNKAIDNVRFHLAGTIFDNGPHKATASSFWDNLTVTGTITFTIPQLNTSVFTFNEGGLTSDLLDSSAITTHWFLDGVPMSPEARTQAGIDGYSLRCHITPKQVLTTGTWAAINITLFPLPKASLLEQNPLATHHNFPGFKLYSANAMPIGFQTAKVFNKLNCGSPILPGVLVGGDWDDLPHTPSTSELRSALAAVMRNVTPPDNRKGPDALAKAWEDLRSTGEPGLKNLSSKLKDLWPEPPTPAATLPIGMHLASQFYGLFSLP